jgi:myosin heavy subunit
MKATDQSFLHKCHRIHESNRLYGKPRLLKTTFSIRHYAGDVEYDVSYSKIPFDLFSNLFKGSRIS